MADFVRVRSAEGPAGEYMAPRSLVEAYPDRYVLIDPPAEPAPVSEPDPVSETAPEVQEPEPSNPEEPPAK